MAVQMSAPSLLEGCVITIRAALIISGLVPAFLVLGGKSNARTIMQCFLLTCCVILVLHSLKVFTVLCSYVWEEGGTPFRFLFLGGT